MKFNGLKSCDTCRKAQKELGAAGQAFEVIDVRADGVSALKLKQWASKIAWQKLLNTRSTTWRNLPVSDKENIDEAKAITLMAANPTLIKRPVIERGGDAFVGWTEQTRIHLGL